MYTWFAAEVDQKEGGGCRSDLKCGGPKLMLLPRPLASGAQLLSYLFRTPARLLGSSGGGLSQRMEDNKFDHIRTRFQNNRCTEPLHVPPTRLALSLALVVAVPQRVAGRYTAGHAFYDRHR